MRRRPEIERAADNRRKSGRHYPPTYRLDTDQRFERVADRADRERPQSEANDIEYKEHYG